MIHCLTHTGAKLVLVDSERADRIAHMVPKLREAKVSIFVVLDSRTRRPKWEGMCSWKEVMQASPVNIREILSEDPLIEPDDNAIIIFTSGTYAMTLVQ